MRSERGLNRSLVVVSFLSLAVYVGMTVDSIGRTTFDDAYMYARYADHWLSGGGYCWNLVDGPSFGVTSPLYLIVITAVMKVARCSDGTALAMTSYVAGLLSVVVAVVLAFWYLGIRQERRSWLPLLIVPSMLLLPPFREHSLTGMETTASLLVNLLLAGSVLLAVRRRDRLAFGLCIASALLSVSMRPRQWIVCPGPATAVLHMSGSPVMARRSHARRRPVIACSRWSGGLPLDLR